MKTLLAVLFFGFLGTMVFVLIGTAVLVLTVLVAWDPGIIAGWGSTALRACAVIGFVTGLFVARRVLIEEERQQRLKEFEENRHEG